MITTIGILLCVVFLDLRMSSVDVLPLSAVFLIISYRFRRRPKLDYMIYIVASAVSVLALFYESSFLTGGWVAFAMLNVVMFTGVLPDRWPLTVKMKAFRDLFSILGFILILPHVIDNLFVDQQVSIFGIAAFLIMIPLFLTSFRIVRREMRQEDWIRIQKGAYMVYVLLFVHLILVADWYGKIIYAVLMTLYINNKLLKEFGNANTRKNRH